MIGSGCPETLHSNRAGSLDWRTTSMKGLSKRIGAKTCRTWIPAIPCFPWLNKEKKHTFMCNFGHSVVNTLKLLSLESRRHSNSPECPRVKFENSMEFASVCRLKKSFFGVLRRDALKAIKPSIYHCCSSRLKYEPLTNQLIPALNNGWSDKALCLTHSWASVWYNRVARCHPRTLHEDSPLPRQ